MKNIFLKYSISPAAYHGGKLNGVDCQEVMKQAKPLFSDIISLLLSVSHPDRCTDDVITSNCARFRDICVTLDTISSKMRIKNGLPTQEDFTILQHVFSNVDCAWMQNGLSYTPKIHRMLCHAFQQMQRLNGFGDLLEDDLEHLHQISKTISDSTCRIKSKVQQALTHSKLEAKYNNKDIKSAISKSQTLGQRAFKKRTSDAISKGIIQKRERDASRMKTLDVLEEKKHPKIVSYYEMEKSRLLSTDS
jgi:hypothetical protein